MSKTFQQYKSEALTAQLKNPELVANEMKSHFNLMESAEDVLWIAHFIVFIFGERLGKWEEGSDLLKKLKNNATIADKAAVKRLTAMLNLGNNPNLKLEGFSDSDKFLILASTAKSLAGLGAIKNAQRLLDNALELKTPEHSSDIQRAHAKLALNYLKNDKLADAKTHAEAALEMVSNSGSQDEALDLFDAYYVLAKTNKAENNLMGQTSSVHGMRNAFDKLEDILQELNQTKMDQIESKV